MSDRTTQRAGRLAVAATFVVTAVIAVFMALQMREASVHDGVYHPVGNDAFYHARRIIDTAGERGFYQFDDTIHVPEGSEITWPWAYDYLLGKALAVWWQVSPDTPAMAFLAPIPTFWLVLNVALFLGIARAAGLSVGLTAIAGLGYALFPFTQILHGIGAIDHHFVEHSFVLAAVLLAMRWLDAPRSQPRAVALALVLGCAPAFHNGLFILQLPFALGLAVAWLRRSELDARATRTFALVLPITTLLVALPSPALASWQFDFTVLSWFHVWVSAAIGCMSWVLASAPFTPRRLMLAVGLSAAWLVPIALASSTGVSFLSGDIALFDRIEETQSPMAVFSNAERRPAYLQLYSLLLVGVPLFIAGFTAWLASTRTPRSAMLAAFSVIGLLLLATQIRLQYFGSFALLLAVPLALQNWRPNLPRPQLAVCVVALAVTALAFQRPLRVQLFSHQNLGLDLEYEIGIELFEDLRALCAEAPGIVLVSNNFGHPARYHSDCSVVANNFLLTPQHEAKVAELDRLWSLSPAALRDTQPTVDYVLFVLADLYLYTDTGLRQSSLEELAGSNPPLAMGLTFETTLPPEYQLIAERPLDDGRAFSAARLFRIQRP